MTNELILNNLLMLAGKGHALDQSERANELAAKDKQIADLTAQLEAQTKRGDGFEKAAAAAELRVVDLETKIAEQTAAMAPVVDATNGVAAAMPS